jgi:uncharacterized protein YkwD
MSRSMAMMLSHVLLLLTLLSINSLSAYTPAPDSFAKRGEISAIDWKKTDSNPSTDILNPRDGIDSETQVNLIAGLNAIRRSVGKSRHALTWSGKLQKLASGRVKAACADVDSVSTFEHTLTLMPVIYADTDHGIDELFRGFLQLFLAGKAFLGFLPCAISY